jgi:predicted GNAT superfamily acetyltransferase
VNRISIHYMPENPVAKPLYASFGFVEVGRGGTLRDGEVIAVLKL